MHTSIRFCVCAALAVTLTACAKKEKEVAPVVPVRVAPAIFGSIHNIITADAILYPRDQANIMPKISAPVRRFHVNRGDHVKAGELLAELENRDLVAASVAARGQMAQAESNHRSVGAGVPEQVTKAQTDVDSTRESLDAAKKVLDNREQLFKDGALARKLVDDAQVAYAQARGQFETAQQHLKALQDVGKDEQVKAAAAQVEAAKGQYESAQAQVFYSEVRSPINGVITDRSMYAGEMANPGGAPLLTVMDVSAVVARINMGQDQAKDVKVGDPATLTPAEGGDPVPGKVTIVSPAVDPNSTTVQVWVQANNPGEKLRAGTSVHVAITAATLDAVLIPATAVLSSDEGGDMVVVVDDKNIAHQKKVTIGVREGVFVQVVAGLQQGERVVTVGGLGLDDKAKVRVMKAGEKRPGEEDEKPDEDEK